MIYFYLHVEMRVSTGGDNRKISFLKQNILVPVDKGCARCCRLAAKRVHVLHHIQAHTRPTKEGGILKPNASTNSPL